MSIQTRDGFEGDFVFFTYHKTSLGVEIDVDVVLHVERRADNLVVGTSIDGSEPVLSLQVARALKVEDLGADFRNQLQAIRLLNFVGSSDGGSTQRNVINGLEILQERIQASEV